MNRACIAAWVLPALVLFLVLLPVACGKRSPVPVYPVQGEVFVRGQPAAGAEVLFHPLSKEKDARPASATVEADGSFRLTTFSAHDGAPVGEYAVTITWRESTREEGETRYGPDRLRYRFSNPATSGLKVTVQADDNTVPRFNLD
jgi:hypothetical protein